MFVIEISFYLLAVLVFLSFVILRGYQLNDSYKENNEGFVIVNGLRTKGIHKMGKMMLENGLAVAQKAIVIENTTNADIAIKKPVPDCAVCTTLTAKSLVVPRNGKLEIKAIVKLPKEHYRTKFITVSIPFANENCSLLETRLSASADFLPHIGSGGILSYGIIFKGESKTVNIEIIKPSKKKEENFSVGRIQSDKIPFLEFGEIKSYHNKVNDDGKVFWENILTIPVRLLTTANIPSVLNGGEIDIFLSDGSVLKVPVTWNMVQKKVFESWDGVFELPRTESNETREFTIVYNSDVGGESLKIETSDKRLHVVSILQEGRMQFIKMQFCADNKNVFGKIGDLLVHTAKETHKLDIVLSKTNGLSEDNLGKENSPVGGQSNMEEIPKAER